MRVSFWAFARTWLLFSVCWWGAGWTQMTRFDLAQGLLPMPSIFDDHASMCSDGCVPCVLDVTTACDRQPGTLAYAKAGAHDLRTLWFHQRWQNGTLPLYIFVPFILGLLGLAAYWVAKFRKQSEEKISNAKSPDSA